MKDTLAAFMLFLLLFAAIFRDSFILTVFYFIAGSFLISNWWTGRVSRSVTFERNFTDHAFIDEIVMVRLSVDNKSILPVPWLEVVDLLPVEIAISKYFQQSASLLPHGHLEYSYILSPKRRGYYPVGPLNANFGDLLGIAREKNLKGNQQYLTVYPRVIPLTRVILPSHSPLGSLPHKQPIFEDPNRPIGKRDYQAGDSIRRIDWKSSASSGKLQVKLFEPSIALETVLFVGLSEKDYNHRNWFDGSELAIVVAASLATWLVKRQQSVGLAINGRDPLSEPEEPALLPAHKGRRHMMQALEYLARIRLSDQPTITHLLQKRRAHLSWGTTIIMITGQPDEGLFFELSKTQRAGVNQVLILCGEITDLPIITIRCRRIGVEMVHFYGETDLNIWRK